MKHQFASLNNQGSNKADSSESEDTDNSQPLLSIEERWRNKEFLTGVLRTDEGWQNQVDRENRTMFEDKTDMRIRIAEQGTWNNQVLFTTIAKLFKPWAIGTHHKTIKNHWTVVPDIMNTITTPITATHTMASLASRVLQQTGCKTKHWCYRTQWDCLRYQ